jgi:very-short-patch-repair endonuclease
LIVEIEGGVHDTPEQNDYGTGRTFELEEKGFKVLRFRIEDILNDINSVLEKIINH